MFGLPEEIIKLVFNSLASVAAGLVIYMLKENISLIKKLSQTMTDFQRDFAVHKQADTGTQRDVEDVMVDVSELKKGLVRTDLRVNSIETILKINKDV
jgi:hypothetical protein